MDDRSPMPESGVATATEGTVGRAARPPLSWLRTFPWLALGIRAFILLLAIGLVVFVARQWDWWVGSAVYQTTDDAYLRADTTPLASKVAGYVRAVPVQDYQTVQAGDVLLGLVDDDYRAQLAQAEANVASAQAAIENIVQQKLLQQALIRQAEATIEATQADLTRFHLDAVRQKELLVTGPGSKRLT